MEKETCRNFAHEELKKWGLTEKGWKFTFNRALSYAGYCEPNKKEIRISGPICEVETEEFIKDTVLHEIAHALAGCEHGHDTVWQSWARKVGASTAATYHESKAIKNAKLAKAKYVMCFEGKVVKPYLRKPAASTFSKVPFMWLRNRKDETYGKLTIEVYNPSLHVEFI